MVESGHDECASLLAALMDYRERWTGEADAVDLFIALLADGDDPFVRERLAGHFTASAWLVSRDGQRYC